MYCQISISIPNTGVRTIINGIWDTGASSSVITTRVAQMLNMVPTGMTRVSASGHSSDRQTYVIDMGLPNGVVIGGLTVTDTTQLSGNIDALIGMDVIGMGDFSITNYQGKTCMSFRVPSLHEIDYVTLPAPTEPKKTLVHADLRGKPNIGKPNKHRRR